MRSCTAADEKASPPETAWIAEVKKKWKLEQALVAGEVLARRHPADRRLVQPELLGDRALGQRPAARRPRDSKKRSCRAHDLGRDPQDRPRPLLEAPHQPAGAGAALRDEGPGRGVAAHRSTA